MTGWLSQATKTAQHLTAGHVAHAGRLADELPYLCCGEYHGFGPLHLLRDGSLGYALSLAMPCTDTKPDAEEEVGEVITQCLHSLDSGVQWQWIVSSQTDIADELERYRQQAGHDTIGSAFASHFINRWQQAQTEGFFPQDPPINFHPRRLRITLALKSAPLGLHHLKPKAMTAFFRRHGQQKETATNQPNNAVANRFVSVINSVRSALEAANWDFQPMDDGDISAWLATVLFPDRRDPDGRSALVPNTQNPLHPLCEAIASMGHIDGISGRGFVSHSRNTSRHHRVVSMMWTPRAVEAGMLNPLILQRANLFICLCGSVQPNSLALLQLKARALLNARSTHRFNASEMQARDEALHEVEHRLFAEGERIVDLRLHLHITERSAAQADQSAAILARQLQTMDIEARVETDIATALILRGELPFAVYPPTEHQLKRRRRLLSRDAAALHPAGSAWTGMPPPRAQRTSARPSPIVMYANSCGEPLFIDPTKAEKNPHALVVGQSGSGKSFFVHDYLLHLWRLPDVRLFLISIKSDYKKLALLLGRYIEVSLDSAFSLNPFGGCPSLENQLRWYTALVLMLTEGRDASIPKEAEIALQTCCLTASQKNWDSTLKRPLRETCLEHICLELDKWPGQVGRSLAQQLQPYRRGPYRKLFNAPRSVSADDRFIFFNLGNILRQPCAALASFCVFQLVDEVMNDPACRGVPKGLIADEVWALVRNAYAAAILERSLKAYRSLGGFALPIVQDPHDLDTPSGRVMLVNTATKIILPLDTVGLADIQKYVQLNQRELDIVRQLRLVKRRYSEFFVSIDGHKSAKGVLIPDAFRYAVSTTDPADEEKIEQLYQRSGNMLEALRQFARETPFGLEQETR